VPPGDPGPDGQLSGPAPHDEPGGVQTGAHHLDVVEGERTEPDTEAFITASLAANRVDSRGTGSDAERA
jgi:hypothetical protein